MNDIKKETERILRDEANAILGLIPKIDHNFEESVDLIYNCRGKVVVVFKQGRISFSKSRVFILDEYYPISGESDLSFVGAIQRQFLNYPDIVQDNVFYLNCLTIDPEDECRRYEQEIKSAGGIDLQILGIGINGHIGFNEPGSQTYLPCKEVIYRQGTTQNI